MYKIKCCAKNQRSCNIKSANGLRENKSFLLLYIRREEYHEKKAVEQLSSKFSQQRQKYSTARCKGDNALNGLDHE